MLRFALRLIVAISVCSRSSYARPAAPTSQLRLPIQEIRPSELTYVPPLTLNGSNAISERLSISAWVWPYLKASNAWALRLIAGYSFNSIGLENTPPYAQRMRLHRLELGPELTFRTGSSSSFSIRAVGLLAGDYDPIEAQSLQPWLQIFYSSRISSAYFDVGFEASRLFGPLVPYPLFRITMRNALEPLRFQAALPRFANLYYPLGTRSSLGLVAIHEGQSWWVGNFSQAHLFHMRELRVGPRIFTQPLTWLALDVRAGLVLLRRLLALVNGTTQAINQPAGLFFSVSMPLRL